LVKKSKVSPRATRAHQASMSPVVLVSIATAHGDDVASTTASHICLPAIEVPVTAWWTGGALAVAS